MMKKLLYLTLIFSLSICNIDCNEITKSNFTESDSKKSYSTEEPSTTPVNTCSIPDYSLNGNYSSEQLESFSNDVFILQAFNFIFSGCYAGPRPIGDQFDGNSLDAIIEGAILAYAALISENPPDDFDIDDFSKTLEKLLDIARRLREEGSTSVFFEDFKEYLNINTPIQAILLYLRLNQNDIMERFRIYLATEFLGGVNPVCRAHSLMWFNDILNLTSGDLNEKLWALEMLDASSKIPSGLMDGNINWVGDYKMCDRVLNENVNPAIKGRYCNAVIGSPAITLLAKDFQISKDFGLNLGMCFSSYCENEDVKSIMSNSLKLIGVFKYAVTNTAKCDDKNTIKRSDSALVYIILLGIIVGWVAIATIYDIIYRLLEFKKKKSLETDLTDMIENKVKIAGENVIESHKQSIPLKKKQSLLHKTLMRTSFYSNVEKIFNTNDGGKFTCIHGIRFFSMVWIIFGHTYNYVTNRDYFFLMSNIRDLLELQEQWYAQLILNGMYAVDTFFLLSAFLVSYNLLKKLQRGLSVSAWIMFYLHRYIRLLPPFLIIIVIYNIILRYYGSGPLWMASDFPLKYEDCSTYWYTYVTFTNNFLPNGKGTKCMGYLWYIPNDFQFYVISPIFIVLLYKFPRAGKALLSFTLIGSLGVLGFLSANVYSSRGKDILATLVDMWEDVYIKPYCRFSPYLCGIFLGYLFFKVKKVKLNYFTVACGWLLSTGLALSALFGGFTNHAKDGRRMEVYEYGLFFSMTRLTWSMSICWIIFACHYGYGGVINTILSCKPYISLNKISYSSYLIHPPIMVYYFFSQQSLFHGNFLTLIFLPISFIFVTFFFAFFFTIFFELPFIALEKLILPEGKKNEEKK